MELSICKTLFYDQSNCLSQTSANGICSVLCHRVVALSDSQNGRALESQFNNSYF